MAYIADDSLPAPSGQPQQEQQLNRGFSLSSALALAFADISPIVALFAIFALGLFAAGPAFFWAFPVVLLGQLLVACVFAELSSRWPFAGSVYQWSRHVRGTKWGWTAAWAYMWGLTIALSSLSIGASQFLLEAVGFSPSTVTTAVVAIVLILLCTACNIAGRKILKIMVVASIICEFVGSIGLGILLLVFHRVNPLSVLFDFSYVADSGWAWLLGPGLLAMAYVGWSFLGFEAAGSIAEEVKKPATNVPKAIIISLIFVATIVMFSALTLILAIPNLGEVMTGQAGDPVAETLTAQFGPGIAKPFLIMIVIGFLSSFLAVQAAVSRCVWGSARDQALPKSTFLEKLSGPERMPVNSIALTGVIASSLVLLAGSDLYAMLVNSATAGFYIAFGTPVLGAAIAHWRKEWAPGEFNMGRWSTAITYTAAAWIVLQTINVVWPRPMADQPWFISWSMIITVCVLGAVGMTIYRSVRDDIKEPIGHRLDNLKATDPV